MSSAKRHVEPPPDQTSSQFDLLAVLHAASAAAPARRDVVLAHAVRAALQLGDDLVGCSITQLDGARFVTVATSGDLAYELDARQYEMGVGPCVSATRDRQVQPEVAPDAYAETNPGFRAHAHRLGVHGISSVPLLGVSHSSGMNFYSSKTHALSSERAVAAMSMLTRAVVEALTDRPSHGGAIDIDPALDAALERRALLERAQAAVAASQQISVLDAFEILMNDSRAIGRSIFTAAREALGEPG